MNITKINTLNTNKQRVSPFKGDTLVSEDNTKTSKNGQFFLYGACVISAGILAIALAGRNGLFTKKAHDVAKTIKNPDNLQNNPIAKVKQVNEIFSQLAVDGTKVKQPKTHELDPSVLQTSIQYPKSLSELEPVGRRMFLDKTMQEISNMSYENQYDEFKFLLNTIKKENPETLDWEFGGIPKNLKRNNYQKFVDEINSVCEEVPALNNTVFYQYRFNEAVNNIDFSICEKLGENKEKSRFFTNVMNKIYGMSYEDQPKALNVLFDALKKQNLETFDWSFVPYRDKFHGDNYDKVLNLINESSNEIPELNNTVFYRHRLAEAFDKNDFSFCKNIKNVNDKFKFFSDFVQKMQGMSYEDQPKGMSILLDALKQEDLNVFNWTYTPKKWNFQGDNFEKIANLIDNATNEKPELNKTVFKQYRVEEALDKWNFSFCDELETVEEKRGFFSDFMDKIYGMWYHDQQKGMDTLFEALKKQDLKTFDWNCLPKGAGLHGDNYNRFVDKINEVTYQIPELNNTVFYKFRTLEAIKREDFSFYKNLKSEPDKRAFLNSYMHKIYGMSEEDQPKAFDAVLKAIKEENPKTFTWKFNISPNHLKGENHSKFIKAINELTEEKPELNNSVFYKYRVDEALEKNDYSVYNILKTDGEKAAFLTDIFNKIIKLDKDNLGNGFSKYLDFIKTLSPEQIQNKILFTMGKFPHDKNLDMANIAISFAKENPAYSQIIARHLVQYQVNETSKISDIAKIRQLLVQNGLKADNTTRTINREDWYSHNNSYFNSLNSIYKDDKNLVDIRRAAFEYDLMNGFTSQEAQEIIKTLTATHLTSKGSSMENLLGLPLKDVVGKINSAINRQA